jgi:hypothetical protein
MIFNVLQLERRQALNRSRSRTSLEQTLLTTTPNARRNDLY